MAHPVFTSRNHLVYCINSDGTFSGLSQQRISVFSVKRQVSYVDGNLEFWNWKVNLYRLLNSNRL